MQEFKDIFKDTLDFIFPYPDGDSKIYFIKSIISKTNDAHNKIKIGVSTNIHNRLKSLQTGNPHILILIYSFAVDTHQATYLESKLHYKFKGMRTHGEWFKSRKLIDQWIDIHEETLKYRGKKPPKVIIKKKRKCVKNPLIFIPDIFKAVI